jgi:hypothetical protein
MNNINQFKNLALAAGTDKSGHHGYHYFYPRHLAEFREDSFNLLEIGYDNGNSARFWENYFPHAELFFMDIGKEGEYERTKVIRGDQSSIVDLERVKKIVGSAKVIVDDGSHHPVHQWDTFIYLFENLLENGGVYIIEDIECNWWRPDSAIYGYIVGDFNAVEKSKSLIEMVNTEFTKKGNPLKVSSVEYGQNCIIVRKQTQEEIDYFNRGYRFGFQQ